MRHLFYEVPHLISPLYISLYLCLYARLAAILYIFPSTLSYQHRFIRLFMQCRSTIILYKLPAAFMQSLCRYLSAHLRKAVTYHPSHISHARLRFTHHPAKCQITIACYGRTYGALSFELSVTTKLCNNKSRYIRLTTRQL